MARRTLVRSVCAALLILTSVQATENLIERQVNMGVMGTSLRIVTLGEDGEALEQAMKLAVAEIQRVEDLLTDWRPSPLMTLNNTPGIPVKLSRELAACIGRALAVEELTGGAFDPTFASFGKLWDFKQTPPRIPDEAAIQEGLTHVGTEYVIVDATSNTVTLSEGTRLGMGGIAKGYGIDRAMKVLQEQGIDHALVDAGGDIKVMGTRNGKPWEMAVKHPREEERALAALRVSNTSVATSGDYERFFEYDGKRYHHIFDPRTGHPATGGMSATVVAPNAEFADALATALCVMGPEKGLALIEQLDRVEALMVDMEGKVYVTGGLKDQVEATIE